MIPFITSAHARAWHRVLAEWDAGQLDVLFPPCHTMPWKALSKFNHWSREKGEAKQHELIGMSSGRKDAGSKNLARIDAAFQAHDRRVSASKRKASTKGHAIAHSCALFSWLL